MDHSLLCIEAGIKSLDIEQQISHARSPLVYEFWRLPGGHRRRVNGDYTEIPSRVNEMHEPGSV